MSTPILTALQQKKTLSARKKSKKLTIKNVLASPYANYWPLIKPEDATSLNEVLHSHLVKIKLTKINVPWNNLKNIPREQRKAFRLSFTKDKLETEEKNSRVGVVFGVNEATKLLESNMASSVLISADANPQLMVKHVIDQAVLKNIPILVVPDLKCILQQKTGISSLAVAFKVSNMDSKYWTIDKKIKEIYCNYPVPPNHINFDRNENISQGKSQILSVDSPMDSYENEEIKTKPIPNFYLYRTSKSERIFTPDLSQERQTGVSVIKMEVDSSGFLGFDDDKSSDSKTLRMPAKKSKSSYLDYDKSNDSKMHNRPTKKPKISYKSLVIKRVTNNKDRDKKKIEMLKRNK